MTDEVEATRRSRPSPAVVGKQFIKRYYDLLTRDPSLMYRFYQDQSAVVCGEGTRSEDPVIGMEQIKAKITDRRCQNAVFNLEHGSLDAQPSKDGGVLLMVTGTITKQNEPPRQFVQSFFLAEQQSSMKTYPPAYFVLNDTFRIVTPPPHVIKSYMETKASSAKSTAATSAGSADSAAELPTTAQVKTTANTSTTSPVTSVVSAPASIPPAAVVATTTDAVPEPPAEVPEASTKLPSADASSITYEAEAASTTVKGYGVTTDGAASSEEVSKVSSWAGIVKSASRKQQTVTMPAPPQSRAPQFTVAPPVTPPPPEPSMPSEEQPAITEAPKEEPEFAQDADPAAPTEASGKPAKKHTQLTADEVPSTAVFVKNIEADMGEVELKAVFESYLEENGHILVASHFDRGFAFVDLGSTAAVARAVSASRNDGIRVGEKRLTVEPSKKPVRPSGLRAMNERKVTGAPVSKPAGQGRGRAASGRGRGGRGEGRGGGPRSA